MDSGRLRAFRLAASFLLILGLDGIIPKPAIADDAAVRIIASIKPVHSLVSGVTEGIATPQLIVRGGASPHTYALRPSDAKALENATVVFWIGPELETFLERPLTTLATSARVVALGQSPGLHRVAVREGGVFESESKPETDAHDHAHGRSPAIPAENHHQAVGQQYDPHIWLDPVNAAAMVHEIARVLGEVDPQAASRYDANARKLIARLDELTAELRRQLTPVANVPFLVFHDAWGHFEHRFGLTAAGALTVNPEVQPGASRLRAIGDRLRVLQSPCIFAEPQFEPRIVQSIARTAGATLGVLDPLGASLPEGPDQYFELMRQNTREFVGCLKKPG